MTDREKALARVVETVRKQLGPDQALLLSEGNRSEVNEVIPVGIEVLDRYLLGCGGLAVGRLMEVYGPEGSGKTSLVCAFLAAAQREGGLALYCETEFAFQEERARTFGVDPATLAVLQPTNLEEAYDSMTAALNAIPNGVGPNLLVWDSIAATPPKAEQEGEASDIAMGHRSRMLNKLCRTLPSLASKKRTALVFVNQIREQIGVTFGDPEVTPGGRSVKFMCTHRLRLGAGKPVKAASEVIGRDVEFKVKKNKVAPPHREAAIRLNFDDGWDNMWATINHAKDCQVIPQDTRVSEKALAEARTGLKWDVGSTEIDVEHDKVQETERVLKSKGK